MLKRKAAPDTSLERRSGGKGSSSTGGDNRDNKRRRKERDDTPRQVMTGKDRQADNKRKKQHGKLFNYLFICIILFIIFFSSLIMHVQYGDLFICSF